MIEWKNLIWKQILLIKKNNLIRYIYSKLPYHLKRDYKYYKTILTLIHKTENWSEEQLELWQFNKLKEILDYAWVHILGYRNLWESYGFAPEKFKSPDDIKLIPFITKEILKDSLDEFSNKNLPNLRYVTTGGSTGIPLGFYEQSHNIMIERAFIDNLWSYFYPDINLDTKRVVLRGDRISSSYVHDPMVGLVLSSYDIDINNVKEYLIKIDKYKYPIFHGYPSAIYQMAKIIKDNQLFFNHRFEVICLGSEPLYNFQKELIEKVFNTNLCCWFGHTERTIFAGLCQNCNRFHIYPQYGLTEIINGEMIGTSFWNYATPLIRYKTQDFAVVDSYKCNAYGKNRKLLKSIDGRLQELVVSKTKKLISMTAINMHDEIFDDLTQFRFYQDTEGDLIFKYIAQKNVNVRESIIYSGLKNKLRDDFNLELKEVENIPKTESGKLRFLDQKLEIKKYLSH